MEPLEEATHLIDCCLSFFIHLVIFCVICKSVDLLPLAEVNQEIEEERSVQILAQLVQHKPSRDYKSEIKDRFDDDNVSGLIDQQDFGKQLRFCNAPVPKAALYKVGLDLAHLGSWSLEIP